MHRSFCVPNDVDDQTDPRISAESNKGKHLADAKLIIIDVSFYKIDLYVITFFMNNFFSRKLVCLTVLFFAFWTDC